MRFLIIGMVAMLLVVPQARAADPVGMPLHPKPRDVPQMSFEDEAGKRHDLSAWRGKVILLNVWATWCGPCRREMPTLDRLQARLGGPAFEVLALSIDRAGPEVVRRFYDDTGIEHLKILVDRRGTAARSLGIPGLPATLLIDRQGRELARLVGPAEWDTAEMISFFERIVTSSDKED